MIRDILEHEAEAYRLIGAPSLIHEFILRNGEVFLPSRYDGDRMEPKQCFRNATVVQEAGSVYAEGFGLVEGLPLLFHHAFRVREDGTVIDPTWELPEDCEYIGIQIEEPELRSLLLAQGFYGILDTPKGPATDFMYGRDPELKTFFASLKKRAFLLAQDGV